MTNYKAVFAGFGYVTQSYIIEASHFEDAIIKAKAAHKARFPNGPITELLSLSAMAD